MLIGLSLWPKSDLMLTDYVDQDGGHLTFSPTTVYCYDFFT